MIGVGAAHRLASGAMTDVHLVSWSSHKLKRKGRSSNVVEAQALCDTEDQLHWLRVMWQSFHGLPCDPLSRAETVKQLPAFLITDSKYNYDALQSSSGGLGVQEKRAAPELSDLQERIEECCVQLRWVHSEANIADAMTKPSARKVLEEFYRNFQWAVVRDKNLFEVF